MDLSRLQGGHTHQWFVWADELEDHDQSVSVPTTPHPGNTDGYSGNRWPMRDPVTADGSKGLSFTWAGTTYGTSVRAFLNGQSGDQVIFSRIPTLRRRSENTDTKDKFPGWHAQRLLHVTPKAVTQFYETWRKGQDPMVGGVKWLPSGDPGTSLVAVSGPGFTDLVYLSDDTTTRTFHGVRFNGRVAIARITKSSGRMIWSYAAGGGSVTKSTHRLRAPAVITTRAVSSTSGYRGTPQTYSSETPDTLTVARNLPQGNALVGTWLTPTLADGTGFAARIEEVTGRRTVRVRGWLPVEVKAGGARRTFYPGTGATDDADGVVKRRSRRH